MIALWVASGSAQTALPLKDYPSLDAEQLGAVRHFVELANRPEGSWELMEPESPLSNDSYQFQLSYMDYALAVVQSQLMPAYRELYHVTSRKLIRKMMQPDVWGVWMAIVSLPDFKKYLDPAKDWRDPVREKNIMYSGHLLQMISLYETLYDDPEFDAPGSIVFEIPGDQGFSHAYNHKALAELISNQFVRGDYLGIECEPDRIFTECNQHPTLGLMQYDQIHGTNLSDVRQKFWTKIQEEAYIDPQSHRTMWFYEVNEKKRLINPFIWSDGWTGIMMHGWQREFVESVYPAQRDAELAALIDTNPERWRVRWGKTWVSIDFGFLAAYAAEVGDRQTTMKLLDYADAHFAPRWAHGGYYYPRHDVVGEEFSHPPQPVPYSLVGQHQLGPLTGNVLLNFARLNPGNGIWNLYNKISISSFAHSGDPELVDVRYPEVQVTQAYYDKAKRCFAVAVVPGTVYQGEISFAIRNLSEKSRYWLTIDAATQGKLDHGRVTIAASRILNANWDSEKQELKLSGALGAGHTIVIKQH